MAATRRKLLKDVAALGCGVLLLPRLRAQKTAKEINVLHTGAAGNGTTNDTDILQHAIDAVAESGGGRVVLPGGKRFLCGGLDLRSGVDLHLADDAVLLASAEPEDYTRHPGLISSSGAKGFRISGTGTLDGQAMKFMTTYSETDERWEPKKFRPYMFSLVRSSDFEITGVTSAHASTWGLHMLGCERVLVDGLRIRNDMDVPNCDGIDPDHCRDVVIRNCDLVGADDSIVIKTSQAKGEFGASHNIHVHDCVMKTRDSGLKVGTETFGDISKILFERCKVISGGRGPTITHRQPGNIEDVEFRDIEVVAEHHAARWWGWGEGISITAWPRSADGAVGSLRNVRLKNVRCRAENSVRIEGQKGQPVRDVLLENVDVTIDRWTAYPGAHFDNRPTMAGVEGLEAHGTPAFSVRHAENVTLRNCSAHWGEHVQPYFSYALESEGVRGLRLEGFRGKAAQPNLPPTRVVD